MAHLTLRGKGCFLTGINLRRVYSSKLKYSLNFGAVEGIYLMRDEKHGSLKPVVFRNIITCYFRDIWIVAHNTPFALRAVFKPDLAP